MISVGAKLVCGALDCSQILECSLLGPNIDKRRFEQGLTLRFLGNLVNSLFLMRDTLTFKEVGYSEWGRRSIIELSSASKPIIWAVGGVFVIATLVYLSCVNRGVLGEFRFSHSDVVKVRRRRLTWGLCVSPFRTMMNLALAYLSPENRFFYLFIVLLQLFKMYQWCLYRNVEMVIYKRKLVRSLKDIWTDEQLNNVVTTYLQKSFPLKNGLITEKRWKEIVIKGLKIYLKWFSDDENPSSLSVVYKELSLQGEFSQLSTEELRLLVERVKQKARPMLLAYQGNCTQESTFEYTVVLSNPSTSEHNFCLNCKLDFDNLHSCCTKKEDHYICGECFVTFMPSKLEGSTVNYKEEKIQFCPLCEVPPPNFSVNLVSTVVVKGL